MRKPHYFPIGILMTGLLIYFSSCNQVNDAEVEYKASNFISDLKVRAPEIINDSAWHEFIKAYSNPYVNKDTVVFMYYGEAKRLQWAGDFNGWSQGEPKAYGKQIEGSNVWYSAVQLPSDARIDYKVIVDGNWILDPDNPGKQMTGVGGGSYNSEFQMPHYVPDSTGRLRSEVDKGAVSDTILVKSKHLKYDVRYWVYTPAGYEKLDELPSLYVTDGQEYGRAELGNMASILDNLIYDNRIQPLIVVFLDPRNPENLKENRRMTELVLNENYVNFVVDELIPEVDTNFKTSGKAEDRGILGTSLGGLNATYFHAVANNSFKRIGINSPAYGFKMEIFNLYDTLMSVPYRIIMTTGVIYDTEEGARKMKAVMESKGYPLQYIEINQGHSWGNWEDLLDDVLIHLYAFDPL